ncbi:amidohydrolase [Streptomyces sp. NBC_00838]|uniref:amidohydrolase n=1 Tax=Streptomyces sp. NBC_00838 TaxID=2903680 RepID=UPI00386A8EB9|nr:amidohydrolase [Streptomyces sp. NBC_00838]
MTTAPESRPADLVITGCTTLTHGGTGGTGDAADPMDPSDPATPTPSATAGDIGFLGNSAIVVRDGLIESITTPEAVADLPAVERIDARGLLAMPGLINCHTHTPMVALRGIAEDLPIEEWFNDWIWPIETNLTDRDIELGALLACAEMIRAGVTTFADHYFAMDRVAAATEASGLRANLGQGYFSSEGAAGLERSLDHALRLRGAAGGRITTSLAPHAPYTVDDGDLAATAELAREHGLLVHIHAAENKAQTAAAVAATGRTPIETLHRAGLLDVDVLIAHGTGLTDGDLAVLRRGTGRVAFATAPKGYLKFGWDPTPLRALASIGVPVGLATDGAASNNTLDVWESMTLTALTQKSSERDPAWLTARQALDHATTQSARAVGLGDRVGALAPGRCADLILVDLTGPHTQPVHDHAATLVYSARSADVLTTIVDGKVLMRDRRLLTLDVPRIVGELNPRLPALTYRGHGRRIQDYDPA